MKVLLSIFILMGFISWAQDGSLDPSFGNNGFVQTDLFEYSSDELRAICDSPSGRITVVGVSYTKVFEKFDFIVAYTVNGQIDTSFGNNGIIQEPHEQGVNYFYVESFNDNSVLVGKIDYGMRSYYKYDANGILDETFADSGVFIPDFPNFEDIIILSDDIILCYGVKIIDETPHVVLQQYLADGSLDISFGNNGEASFTVANGTTASTQGNLTIGAEGKFIVGLRTESNGTAEHSIVRFNADGSIDETFGNGGQKIISLEPEYWFSPQAIPGSDILYLNCSYYDPVNEIHYKKTLKLDEEGNLDLGFGNNGSKVGVRASLVQPNGRFFDVTFWSDWEGVGHIDQFNRYFGDGSYDDSFDLNLAHNDFNFGAIRFHRYNGTLMIAGSTGWYNGFGHPDIILQQFNNSPLGVDDFQKQNILVSPNPSTGRFHFDIENFEHNQKYFIYDITGKLVQTGAITHQNATLDLSSFEAGMYFLHLGNTTLKLIKN